MRILEHFSLDGYFDRICGASMDEKRVSKADVIRYTLETNGLVGEEAESMMIGDRCHDIAGAKETGLADIAAAADSSVLFVYPTAKDGWAGADESLYAGVIAEVKMNPFYKDGICEITDFFTREYKGSFVRGAIFRADIYSYGASADYVAKNLLKTLQGEYLWVPAKLLPQCAPCRG